MCEINILFQVNWTCFSWRCFKITRMRYIFSCHVSKKAVNVSICSCLVQFFPSLISIFPANLEQQILWTIFVSKIESKATISMYCNMNIFKLQTDVSYENIVWTLRFYTMVQHWLVYYIKLLPHLRDLMTWGKKRVGEYRNCSRMYYKM